MKRRLRDMMWVVLLATLLAPVTSAADEQLEPATVASVFAAACSIEQPGSLTDTQLGNGLTRAFMFVSGPPPGTQHGHVAFQGRQFPIVARESRDGFCALRFPPLDAAAVRAELDRRYRASSEYPGWIVHRTDGEGLVAYRPFVAGMSGPAWIGRPGGHMFGFNAAEREDTLVFYAPPLN